MQTYPIGDVARRTGLAVSAIRFYSDEGIVTPAGLNGAGHRLYDLRAIAQLELIRTLRDLGTGLDEIRRLIDGEMTLPDLLASHLTVVERQVRELRSRQAVLRALNGSAERAALMRRLVVMSDEERERLIDEFWNDVGAGLPDGFVDRLRAMRPRLPDDPTAAQLEAWIELADLVRDAAFRDAVRAYLHDYATAPFGPAMTATSTQDFLHGAGSRITERIIAAHRCGLPPESAHAQELVGRLVSGTVEGVGGPATPDLRDRLAAVFARIGEHIAEAGTDPEYRATHGRYLSLVAAINDAPADTRVSFDVDTTALGAWISAALRVPAAPATED